MKNLVQYIAIATILLSFGACSSNQETNDNDGFGVYGDSTTNKENAVAVNTLPELLAGMDSISCKLEGDISGVCQTKGCWMTMPISEEDDLFIKFKDYGFFVPMNAESRNAVIDGIAYVDTVSINELKHRAQDAKKDQEEIDAIDKEKVEYTFMATGVVIE